MADHNLSALGVTAGDLEEVTAHIAVAGAVEAVFADVVLLVVLMGHSVHIRLLGHGLMKGGVEHGDHGDVGAQDLPAGPHGSGLRRIVERP